MRLESKKFQKMKEDFVCENCGQEVTGNGYTNHCPNCLWSKHVDINPGDREAGCGGLMEPSCIEKRGDVFYLVHKCLKCGFVKKNKAIKGDNFNELVKLSINKDN